MASNNLFGCREVFTDYCYLSITLIVFLFESGIQEKLPVQRRKEPNLMDLTTEVCIQSYQLVMGDVERGDHIRETGAGFCQKSHFKNCTTNIFCNL